MDKIIFVLKVGIEFCEYWGEDFNNSSWTNQQGVLITANEAKKIVYYLEELKKLTNN